MITQEHDTAHEERSDGRSWTPRESARFTLSDLQTVIDGTAPAMLVRNYLSPERCELAVSALNTYGFDDYPDREAHVQRIGVPRIEYVGSADAREQYFDAVAAVDEIQRRIFNQCGDLIEGLIGTIARSWPGRVGIAFEPDLQKAYGAGVIRRIRSALPHVDWVPMDGGDWVITRLQAQLAINIFLQVPQNAGGETLVYDRMWTPALETYREPGAYWYREDALTQVRSALVTPCTGDLMIFNSRNVHAVRPVTAGDRLTLSVFGAVLSDSNELLLFS